MFGYEGEGVWYVDFDQPSSGEEILARAIGVQSESLYDTLREQRVLLICDSCRRNPAVLSFYDRISDIE